MGILHCHGSPEGIVHSTCCISIIWIFALNVRHKRSNRLSEQIPYDAILGHGLIVISKSPQKLLNLLVADADGCQQVFVDNYTSNILSFAESAG